MNKFTLNIIKFSLIVIWIILTRIIDIICTYNYTPSLSNEANPLVYFFCFNWFCLITTIFLILMYAIYSFYLVIFKLYNLYPLKAGYDFKGFCIFLYLGRDGKLSDFVFKLPNDLKRLNFFLGNILYKCLVFVGFLTTLMWYLLYNIESYKKYHSPIFLYFLIILFCGLIIYNWYKAEYIKYNKTNH